MMYSLPCEHGNDGPTVAPPPKKKNKKNNTKQKFVIDLRLASFIGFKLEKQGRPNCDVLLFCFVVVVDHSNFVGPT